MALDGPMTLACFLAYADQALRPTLRPGDVMIFNNLPAHQGTAIRKTVQATGAALWFAALQSQT